MASPSSATSTTRLLFLITTLFLGFTAKIVTAQFGATIVPGARALTLEEVLKVIATETSTEFNWSDLDPILQSVASKLWQDANSFEWQKASEAEFFEEQKYPYLLCHIGTDLKSGYQRKLALAKAINYTEDQDLYFRTLYNEDTFLCVYGQLLASVAGGVTGEEFIVQPIVPSLKMMSGSVGKMQSEDSYEDDGYSPSLDIVLCPGVALANATANNDNAAANEQSTQGWEDVPSEMAQEIVDTLVPKTIASKLANSISETYYLTSEAYIDSASELDQETTERSKLWKSLIEDYQESGKCDATYESRLSWTIQRARKPETHSSMMNVEFDTTGDSISDAACFLTLSLAIAAHPDVCSLELKERVKTANTVSQWLVQSEVKDRRPFFDVGLDGSGQVVAVSDTGVDRDNCYFAQDTSSSNFMDTNARKIVQYKDFVDGSDMQYGHGTHVVGTVAGNRIDGTGMADGVAPGAKIAFADIGDNNGALYLPLDSQLLATGRPFPGCTDCAHIHSASWGAELPTYTTQARNFDNYMYEHDTMLIVVAAGNSGHGDAPRTVGSPATGKNIIAVGAHHNTENSRPSRGLGPAYIADFSSRGPTFDGRTVPHLMAPGKAMLSAGALPDVSGECDPSRIPDANGRSEGVLSLQGTSMATPVVSGTAAILRQYFVEGFYPDGVKNETVIVPNPSGALIKAVLMNGAQFLKGVDNGANGVTEIKPYDNNQNFGHIALQHSVYLPGKTEVQLTAFDRKVVNDQESRVETIKIDKSDGCTYDKLSVTLVWVEEGSSPGCTRCVLNDLDLTVEMKGTTYFPNGRTTPDRTNSAERVIIGGVNDGDVATITVTANNLQKQWQHYSLVATGCFGGVANRNFENECSVFECDDSEDKRLQNILMGIFIPLGVILLCGCGYFFYKRKNQAGDNYDV